MAPLLNAMYFRQRSASRTKPCSRQYFICCAPCSSILLHPAGIPLFSPTWPKENPISFPWRGMSLSARLTRAFFFRNLRWPLFFLSRSHFDREKNRSTPVRPVQARDPCPSQTARTDFSASTLLFSLMRPCEKRAPFLVPSWRRFNPEILYGQRQTARPAR